MLYGVFVCPLALYDLYDRAYVMYDVVWAMNCAVWCCMMFGVYDVVWCCLVCMAQCGVVWCV